MDLIHRQQVMKRKNLEVIEGIRQTGVGRKNAVTLSQFKNNNRAIEELLVQDKPQLTYAEIGRMFGLTRERIRQISSRLGLPKRWDSIRARRETEAAAKALEKASVLTPCRDAKSEYAAYCSAKQRCINPNHPSFKNYGGRGIEFRFDNFIQFYDDIGKKPEGNHPSGVSLFSVHRKDNNGHYEIGNVVWATSKEQNERGARRPKVKTKQ